MKDNDRFRAELMSTSGEPVEAASASTPDSKGFREVLMRVKRAVVDSERLVVVLDRLARQGLRPRGSSLPLSPSDVQEPIRAVRAAVGRLANTTPSKFSSDFDQYTQSVGALIAVGRCVLDRGVEPAVKLEELDEWTPFRER